jgi:hypothetical protein
LSNGSYFCFMTKQQVIEAIARQLNKTIAALTEAVVQAQNSANQEDKSSAGDKYETGRAMAQNTRDMYATQLTKAKQQLQEFEKCQNLPVSGIIGMGSLVQTSQAWYYLGAGLGAMNTSEGMVMSLSPIAPFAKVLLGKKQGDTIVFMDKVQEVLQVF